MTEDTGTAMFEDGVIDEEMLRRYIAKVKAQFPKYETQPHVLEITALAWACERLLDERAAASVVCQPPGEADET